MEQGYKSVGIVGAGASGCICAYYLAKAGIEVTLFDSGKPLRTILPTGGGRCNLAHAEYDFKELAKNYPRGEKFLYSVFSEFSTYDTIALFEELGIKTYTQDDGRIFPLSNDAKDVREKILKSLKNVQINAFEKVLEISPQEKGFKLKTEKAEYLFSDIIISTGGNRGKCRGECRDEHAAEYCEKYIQGIEHNIIPPKPSLVGLNTDIKNLSGIVLKNVLSKDIDTKGDLLFTHFGISGPLTYKISSIKAREELPYSLTFDLYPEEYDLQTVLNTFPHKDLKNILSDIFPQRFAVWISGEFADRKAHTIDGKTRDLILNKIHNFELKITGTNKGEETVTAGGYDLNQINPKTMESKICPHLYIIGEALNIDGFCGGFNLQNAWSTAFVAANGILSKIK